MKVLVSETNLNEVLEYIYFSFEQEAKEKGIKLHYEHGLPLKEAIVCTDQNKVKAILISLLNNAIKFTEKGIIKFGYIKEGLSLIFFVKDSGIGIGKELKNIIDERLGRVSTKLIIDYSGEGLGLSISKANVELLGGEIWVESELKEGACFYFSIPYNAIETEPAINKAQNSVIPNPALLNKNLKILIVDDYEVSAILIRELVTNFAREIIIAKSGLEAVEACKKNEDIDLILMDIRMPWLDGYEATRQIRLFNREVIIVAQTGMAFNENWGKAINAGFDDYILKPFAKNVFERMIEKHFGLV